MERPAHTALFQSIWNHPAEENGQNVNLGSWGGEGGSFCGLPSPLLILVAAIIRAPANYRVVHLVIFLLFLGPAQQAWSQSDPLRFLGISRPVYRPGYQRSPESHIFQTSFLFSRFQSPKLVNSPHWRRPILPKSSKEAPQQ